MDTAAVLVALGLTFAELSALFAEFVIPFSPTIEREDFDSGRFAALIASAEDDGSADGGLGCPLAASSPPDDGLANP